MFWICFIRFSTRYFFSCWIKKKERDILVCMNRKKIIVITSILLAITVITFFMVIKKITDKPFVIAYYNVPEKVQSAVQASVQACFQDDRLTVKYVQLDKSRELQEQLTKNKKISIIITQNSKALADSYTQLKSLDKELFNAFPSTFQNIYFPQENETEPLFLPLALNPLALLCYQPMFNQLTTKHPENVQAWENMLGELKAKVDYPLIVAGTNDTNLFYMIDSVMAAQGDTLKEFTTEFTAPFDLHAYCPPPLQRALKTLVNWRKKGYLHPEWFRLQDMDISIFMQTKHTAMVCMDLAALEELDSNTLADFETSSVPLSFELIKRNYPTELFVIAEMQQSLPQTEKLLAFFAANETQTDFAKNASLAPASLAAQTVDARASSARYRVASANLALPSLKEAVCKTESEKSQLASQIRDYIEVNGVGYDWMSE